MRWGSDWYILYATWRIAMTKNYLTAPTQKDTVSYMSQGSHWLIGLTGVTINANALVANHI